MKRYRLILLPCEYTDRKYHNAVLCSADKLVDLDLLMPSCDQLWHVLDSKTGKVLSQEEALCVNVSCYRKGMYGTGECVRHI